MQQKIVIIGGPGTGKSTILNELISRGFYCMPEISREVIKEAQKKGIEQLFLTDPLLFSDMLLEGREKQYVNANNTNKDVVFFDRGIPDAHAYMDYSKTKYPDYFFKKSNQYRYTKVFMLPPWKEIFISDNERYEDFETAVKINHYLIKAYQKLNYKIATVPFGTIKERTDFILNSLKSDI